MGKRETIKAKVHQIILENMPNISAKDLSDDTELFALGLNSLNAVSLVLELEESFGFEFDMDEISYESFKTITDIIELVEGKEIEQ